MQYVFSLSLLLPLLASSSPINVSKVCSEHTFNLNVSSANWKWARDPINSNAEMAALNANFGRRDADTLPKPLAPPTSIENTTYTISGTFCKPSRGGRQTVLLATHGQGYNRAYWDPSIQPDNYSFVGFAIAQGYPIFYYDRLATGNSQIPSGYVPQVANQASVLQELIKQIRAGKLPYPADTKLVLVGHSFGSVVSNAVLHSSPISVDAAVLTGVSYYGVVGSETLQAKQLRLANTVNAQRWGSLDNAYMTWVDKYSNAEQFFKYPFYDRDVLQWAEDNKEPTGLIEAMSIATANFSSPGFEGPVLVMSGEYDFAACKGNCHTVLDKGADEIFPHSRKLETYIHPNSGHAINLGLNATGAFQKITDFLQEAGF